MMNDKPISFVSLVYIRISALKFRLMKINILVLHECHNGFERYISDTNGKRIMFF